MVAAEFWALVTLGTQFIGTVQENIELVSQIWVFLKLFPEWLNHHKQLGEKVKTLKRKQETLNCRADDFIKTLEKEEVQIGKRRRKEVETWMKNVETKRRDVRDTEQKAGQTKYLLGLLLENTIERNLKEVEELLAAEFPNGLTLNTHLMKAPFPTKTLTGRDSDLTKIMHWLSEPNVSTIGVYGVKGVGKTAILTHIQSRLSQSTSTAFEHVYWVSVTEQPSVCKLQNVIAKQVGLNLSDDDDEMIRAAKLHGALTRRGKCVIILDGVGKPFTEEVGIPKEAIGCKVVLSTESKRNCKRMDCDKELEIKLLPHDQALQLFRQKLSLRDLSRLGPDIEEVLELIVRECQGLPGLLVNVAERLRGVDDINEWRDSLTELINFRKGIAN